jgi:hypothetical protein
MKTIQKEIILQALEDKNFQDQDGWVVSWKLIKNETPYGFLGTSGDRQARSLFEEWLVERKHIGKYAYYKAKQEDSWTKCFQRTNNLN